MASGFAHTSAAPAVPNWTRPARRAVAFDAALAGSIRANTRSIPDPGLIQATTSATAAAPWPRRRQAGATHHPSLGEPSARSGCHDADLAHHGSAPAEHDCQVEDPGTAAGGPRGDPAPGPGRAARAGDRVPAGHLGVVPRSGEHEGVGHDPGPQHESWADRPRRAPAGGKGGTRGSGRTLRDLGSAAGATRDRAVGGVRHRPGRRSRPGRRPGRPRPGSGADRRRPGGARRSCPARRQRPRSVRCRR